MKKRFRSIGAVSAIAIAGLVALATPPASADEVVWPSWWWGQPVEKAWLDGLVADYTAKTGNTVNGIAVPFNTFWDKQYTDVSAGSPPDVVTFFDPEVKAYIDADLLLPLNKYLEEAGISLDGNFSPAWKAGARDGQIYAIPVLVNTRALLYNKKLLDEAGIAPPTNVDEFYAALQKLRKPDSQQFGIAMGGSPQPANLIYLEIAPLISGYGGAWFTDGKPTANSQQIRDALTFYKKIYDEGLIPRGVPVANYRDMFYSGKLAMYAAGPFVGPVTKSKNPEIYANLGAVPLPFPAGHSFTLTVYNAIPKGAPHPDAAGKLLAEMLTEKQQNRVASVMISPPSLNNAYPAGFFDEYPWFRAFADYSTDPNSLSYAPHGAEDQGPEIMQIINTNLEKILYRGAAVDATLDELQAELEAFAAKKN